MMIVSEAIVLHNVEDKINESYEALVNYRNECDANQELILINIIIDKLETALDYITELFDTDED